MEGIGTFLVGMLFTGVGLLFWFRERNFFKRAIMVRGIVTGISESQSHDSDHKNQTMYSAIVTFEFDGQTRQVTEGSSSSWKPKLGTVRQVGVDPADIQNVRVYSRFILIMSAGFILLGLSLMGAQLYEWF